MDMTKQDQEILYKSLCRYLPYDLKVKEPNDGCISELIGILKDGNYAVIKDYGNIEIKDIKPILRPLSDLTKEIEHNGEKFVPAIELSKIAIDAYNDDMDDKFKCVDVKGIVTITTPWFHKVVINYMAAKGISIRVYRTEWGTTPAHFENTDKFYEKLKEWHFDLDNLIERDLAVNYNTLES